MAATDPDYSKSDLSINGNESWFNDDVRIFEDLYVYGNLYYNFEGTDSLDLDQLNVTGIATFFDVDITNLNVRNIFSTGIVTFPEIDNLQVGFLTVTESFQFINSGNEYFTLKGTGSRAGRVGIGSTLPDQKLDIGGSIHIDEQIFDSDNAQGNPGNYLGKDEGGIRWVEAPPFSQVDGFFAKNEGINIGISSFSTINLIGDRSGGDIVFGTVNALDPEVLDVDIRSRWVKNSSGIHTISNVGIGTDIPAQKLDVIGGNIRVGKTSNGQFIGENNSGIQKIKLDTNGVSFLDGGNLGIGTQVPTDAVIKANTAVLAVGIVTTNSIFSRNLDVYEHLNTQNLIITGFGTGTISTSVIAGFAATSGISTFSITAGFALTAGISTFSTTAGFALTSGISTNTNNIDVDSTDEDSSHHITFIDSTDINEFHKLKIDGSEGLIFNPSKNLLTVGQVNITGILTVGGATTLHNSLEVDGLTTFNDDSDATSTTNASVQIDGGVGIVKKLFVGSDTKIEGTTESSSKDTGALVVEGGVGIEKKLFVGSDSKIEGTTESSSKDTGALIVEGGVGIEKKLFVGSDTKIEGTTDSSSKDTGALIVEGGVGIEKKLFVGSDTKIDGTTASTDKDTGALIVEGGVGIEENINIGGSGVITGTLDVDGDTQSNDKTSGALVVDGGVGVAKNLNIGENTKIEGTLELDGPLKDINDTIANPGAGKTDYRLSSVGTGVSWRPSGVETKNILYVTKDGSDANSGLLEGDAKATIGGAAEVAEDGDTIYVRPGVYFEDNPVGLRTDVSISGQDLRLVTVVPKNVNDDIFHVRRGCLVENLNFASENFGVSHVGCGCLAFPPIQSDIDSGAATIAQSGYVGPGPANEGPSGRWRSPYARNCTNFITGSIGLKIDGRYADASFTGTNNLGQDLRSMVCDSFTQYNEAGIGVSVTNKAYAQLVSIFTINSRIGIFAGSGGQCDLTNSNSSFGDFGLFADGTSDAEFTGSTTGAATAESDAFSFKNVKDSNNTVRKPFDGQSLFFKINLADYPEVTGYSGIVNKPMKTLREIKIVNGGNPGDYSAATPPNVLVTAPAGPEAILAELSANVSAAGTITSVDVVSNGRNFLPTQPIEVTFSGTGGAVGLAVTDPILFTVDEATEPTSAGLTTVTFNEFVPYSVGDNVDVEFLRISRIITSSHSFEYVGAGTDINRANPFQGGEPIPENEIVAINGGQIPFTSTDQKGNFRIGEGLTIDQTTSTISGRDFNRAIQANLTPLILALGG